MKRTNGRPPRASIICEVCPGTHFKSRAGLRGHERGAEHKGRQLQREKLNQEIMAGEAIPISAAPPATPPAYSEELERLHKAVHAHRQHLEKSLDAAKRQVESLSTTLGRAELEEKILREAIEKMRSMPPIPIDEAVPKPPQRAGAATWPATA